MTVWLVITNVVAFLLQLLLIRVAPKAYPYFPLSVAGLRQGYVWQLITFQFMHAGPLHLLLNCWGIFMFGREVEEALGRNRFLTLYFSSGVIGGLLQAAFTLLLAQIQGNQSLLMTQVVGASAGAFGLIAAFATLYPERPLMLLLFFIIPVNMRAKFLLLFEGLVALLGMAYYRSGGGHDSQLVAHAAHLGGMLTGIFFVRHAVHWQWHQLNRVRRRPPQPLIRVPSERAAAWRRSKTSVVEDLPPDEFLSKEVDPILDKISAQGIQSLTDRERRILEAAREKMARR